MFNDDQKSWMRYLGSLASDQKCACGWDVFGGCHGACWGELSKGGALKAPQRVALDRLADAERRALEQQEGGA